jgi:hypothetical protein
MEAWIKRYQNRDLVEPETILIKRYEQSWMDNYGLYIYPNGKVAASSYSPDIWTWFDLKSAKNISAGDWYHIAATYDRTTLKIYINGVLDNSVNAQYTPYQNNYQLVIGRACWGDPCLFKPSNPSFNGIIDEVRIFNRALSDSEIQAEYDAFSTPKPTTGTISVTTNLADATFSLTGASSYSGSGTSWSTANAPAGTYTITYGTMPSYNAPSSETKTLSAGGSIAFSGTYVQSEVTPKPVTTPGKFRVGPSVTLRPVTDVIEANQDGIVELFMNNPSLNDVTLNVDARVSVPSGIHVYGESFGQAAGAGVVAGTFSVPPGTSRTIVLVIKADKSARIGSHTIQFTGLYYPDENKDAYNPMSLTYSVTVKEPSQKPEEPPKEAQAAAAPSKTPGFGVVLAIFGVFAIARLLSRK